MAWFYENQINMQACFQSYNLGLIFFSMTGAIIVHKRSRCKQNANTSAWLHVSSQDWASYSKWCCLQFHYKHYPRVQKRKLKCLWNSRPVLLKCSCFPAVSRQISKYENSARQVWLIHSSTAEPWSRTVSSRELHVHAHGNAKVEF